MKKEKDLIMRKEWAKWENAKDMKIIGKGEKEINERERKGADDVEGAESLWNKGEKERDAESWQ